jgi:uncharacterized protein (DUF427 family)
MIHPTPEPKTTGQESVWDYPRPAIVEQVTSHLKIMHRGVAIAETKRGVRTLETSHPPSYYFPREDVAMHLLSVSQNTSVCEWKGNASYFDVNAGGAILRDSAWSYANPTRPFALLRNHIAFYAAPFEDCFVDGEKVVPQPGGFYGGWITSRLAGPFKGISGSRFW